MSKKAKWLLHTLCVLYILSPFTEIVLRKFGVEPGSITVYYHLVLALSVMSLVITLTYFLSSYELGGDFIIGLCMCCAMIGVVSSNQILFGFMKDMRIFRLYFAGVIVLPILFYAVYFRVEREAREFK